MISIVVSVALIVCMVASIYLARHVRLLEYTSHRASTSFGHLLFTNLATLIGGWMFFGLSAVGYQAGVVGYVIGIAYALGMVFLGLLVPRVKNAMVEANCDTLDDFIGARYGPVAQAISTTLNLIFFVAILAAQFIAMAGFLKVFARIETEYLYPIAAIVVIAYTMFAGFKGVLLTDVWQFIFLAASVLILIVVLALTSDWTTLMSLESTYFNGTGYGVGFLAAMVVIFPISVMVRTDLWQRIASAQDTRAAQRAFFLSAPLLIIFYVLLTTGGMLARAMLGPGVRPDTSAFMCFLSVEWGPAPGLVAQGLTAILSLGIFSALLSTADTNLNLVAVSLSKLFRRTSWARFEAQRPATASEISDLERFLMSEARLITVLVGASSLFLATILPDIVNLIVGAAAAVMVFIPCVLFALFTNSRNRGAAIASLSLGSAALIPSMIYAPKIAMIPAAVTAALAFLLVVLFARPKE